MPKLDSPMGESVVWSERAIRPLTHKDFAHLSPAYAEHKAMADKARENKLAGHGGDRKSDAKQDQDSHRSLKYGETADYLLARIARDNPDILNRFEAGEFPSVRQAAIAAGIAAI